MSEQIVILRNNQCKLIRLITYPDGQANIVLDLASFNVKHPIHIKCSIRNWNELEVLSCLIASLKRHDFIIENLAFIYLFGLRSDRMFEPGSCNYVKDILAPIINNFEIPIVRFLEPHGNSLHYFYGARSFAADQPINESMIRINGDQSYQSTLDPWEGNPLFFHKTRDQAGNIHAHLKKEQIALIEEKPNYLPILIEDDFCDGGATFIFEAMYLKKLFPHRSLLLCITHALFSKGIDAVADHFNAIYCTNSYQDIDHPKVIQTKVI